MDLKIRIFALAKELGMDSKILIEYCNSAGIQIKNSALASISPEEKDRVLKFMENATKQGSAATASAPLAPSREPTRDTGKIRSIKPMMPRPQNGKGRRPEGDAEPETVGIDETASEEVVESVPIEAPTAVAEPQTADAPRPVQPAAETTAPAPTPTRGPLRRGPGIPTTMTPNPSAPLRPDDYVSPTGARGSSIREMRPVGTVTDADSLSRRSSKSKGKPSLPTVALPPNYKPPVARTAPQEAPAQKPDIPLTAEFLGQPSPLSQHLRKSVEQRKKKKKGDDGSPVEFVDTSNFIGEDDASPEAKKGRRLTGSDRRRPKGEAGEEGSTPQKLRGLRRRRQRSSGGAVALKTAAEIAPPITIRTLSEAIGRPARDLQRILFERGEACTINQSISEDVAIELALELGVDLEIRRQRDIELELEQSLETPGDAENLVERPPIVTILGHVDHGKTSLLDKIRSANVAAGEAGGITQHIAAYQVSHNNRKITFVDTPGHAAFSEMRARGANVTDVVVLVVASDDGVMPQTVECISHARAANVPMVVAMNKVDLPNRNEQRVLQELAANNVLPAEWGGDVEVVRTSATTGQGIDDLLETLLLTAELREFKADVSRPAAGVCLEAFRDEGRGVLAWFVVQTGTLKIGDNIVCGEAFGRIRALYNDQDKEIQEAGPSTPVRVAGLDVMPGAGDRFFVVGNVEEAREVADTRRDRGRTATLSGRGRPRSLDDILSAARGGAVQDLPLVIKADTPGSLEALRHEIGKIDHPEVRVQIVHEGVGGVNESDVSLAEASGAIIIAFHVIPEDRAQILAERQGVDIRRYNIIYEVTETVKRSLEGLLLPERVQVATGRALVLQTFHISRFGTIAGCRVLNGTIERSNRVHVIRDQAVLADYDIASLKRNKDDAKEVREGMECGIRLEGFNDVKEGDLLEAFRVDEIKRTLE
ncbi:MAG: translation initiation factor IF-2 [Planctomycetaceae bacterium]